MYHKIIKINKNREPGPHIWPVCHQTVTRLANISLCIDLQNVQCSVFIIPEMEDYFLIFIAVDSFGFTHLFIFDRSSLKM